jgi:hypothetical protein
MRDVEKEDGLCPECGQPLVVSNLMDDYDNEDDEELDGGFGFDDEEEEEGFDDYDMDDDDEGYGYGDSEDDEEDDGYGSSRRRRGGSRGRGRRRSDDY